MQKNFIKGSAAALILMALPLTLAAQAGDTPAPAQPRESVASLEQQAAKAQQEERWVAWYSASMKLHKLRPDAPEYLVDIVRAAAMADQRRTAYNYMVELQKQGLSYDFNRFPETESIRGTQAYDYVNDLMIEAGKPSGVGQMMFEMDLAPISLGDVAWDESREKFLVGTRDEGKVLAVNDKGKFETVLQANGENGLWSIDGLAVDTANNTLWVSSTASPAFNNFSPADANKGALYSFELDSLKLKARYGLPADGLQHSLGSIAVTEKGDVYVVDRAVPIVFRKPDAGSLLEPFGGSPELVALTDIAVTPDNSRIFVTDAVMGILLIDPVAKRMAKLGADENLNTYGIYGIEYVDRELVVTQSGISPQRIIRLTLDQFGSAVEAVAPMATALEAFDTPGVGTIRGDSLYYFANHGSLSDSEKLRLMSTPLDSGVEVKPPDRALFERAMKQKAQEQQQQQQQ